MDRYIENVKGLIWERPIENYKYKEGTHLGKYEDKKGNQFIVICVVRPELFYRSFIMITKSVDGVQHSRFIDVESKAVQVAEEIIADLETHIFDIDILP